MADIVEEIVRIGQLSCAVKLRKKNLNGEIQEAREWRRFARYQ